MDSGQTQVACNTGFATWVLVNFRAFLMEKTQKKGGLDSPPRTTWCLTSYWITTDLFDSVVNPLNKLVKI